GGGARAPRKIFLLFLLSIILTACNNQKEDTKPPARIASVRAESEAHPARHTIAKPRATVERSRPTVFDHSKKPRAAPAAALTVTGIIRLADGSPATSATVRLIE